MFALRSSAAAAAVAPLRHAVRSVRTARVPVSAAGPSVRPDIVRPIHSSAPSLKKRRVVEEDFSEDLDPSEETDELFSSLPSGPGAGSSPEARAALRAQLVASVLALADPRLNAAERRGRVSQMRVGTVRRIAQLSAGAEGEGGVQELKAVLGAWRVAGGRVTVQTAREIVGRCLNLGRLDLAQEFANDSLQYGLPSLPLSTRARLDAALSEQPTATATAAPVSDQGAAKAEATA